MTDAQFAAYEAYLHELAELLLLSDWEIALDRSRPETEGAWAEVTIMKTQNYARVSVCWPAFFHESPEDQREYLTHELVHCHFTRMQNVVTQLADMWDENSACRFARVAWEQQLEIAVQNVARLLMPHLPLPPELPKETEKHTS